MIRRFLLVPTAALICLAHPVVAQETNGEAEAGAETGSGNSADAGATGREPALDGATPPPGEETEAAVALSAVYTADVWGTCAAASDAGRAISTISM
ncbi:MAG TPA: hypothetical protein VEZ48_02270 [Sphingomonadaceae bacterium]|nr:hypothetical protein [Sphingomonadaceae bacterium]